MSVVDAVRRANAKAAPEESVSLRIAVLVAILAATMATLAQGLAGPSFAWHPRLASQGALPTRIGRGIERVSV